MPKFPILPLTVTRHQVVSALEICLDMVHFKQILTQVLVLGLWHDNFVVGRLLACCATSNSGDLHYARLIFDYSANPTAFSYNTMIRGYSDSNTPIQSLHLFYAMRKKGIYADKYTFTFVLKASARTTHFPQAWKLHAHTLKCGFRTDLHVQTSLLHMYTAFGRIESSKRVFDEMPQKSTVAWNAIISCYLKSNREVDSLILFGEMVMEQMDMNDDTLVSVMRSCANLGALVWGKCVHGFVIRRRASLSMGAELGTSLVHMYAKCGNLESGIRVFDEMDGPDVPAWTAMIGGLAMYGHGKEAVSLFDKMLQQGLKPDSVTFTSVLHACTHSGMVRDGLRIFNSMKDVYGFYCRIEHFGTMVDLLGRAGYLEEAEQLVNLMPIQPNGVVWVSLLNACVINGEFGAAERIGNHILGLGLQGLSGAFYVVMSNVYAKVEKWEEVKRMRETMIEKGLRKDHGHSLVEVNGRVHMFLVSDTTHPQTEEIYVILHGITKEMAHFCY
ncbi:pentatricopeptide repeat-containing protein At5g66520-like [Magnolia sinica]|uniref:pentatricopeptide repeat-containing protein At5g66520-like n=1 Tax=Magnolia sinica TaxID=86752 RepID=UPI00265908E7|nr:pentatricopeptide repeat-containing protein At5g66520-like [Magnolia sinica]